MSFVVFGVLLSLVSASVVRRAPQVTATRTSTVYLNETTTTTPVPTGPCSGCFIYWPSPIIEFNWPQILWTTSTVATIVVQIDTAHDITSTIIRTATVSEVSGTAVSDLTSFWRSALNTTAVNIESGKPTLTFLASVYTQPGAYTVVTTILPYKKNYVNMMYLAATYSKYGTLILDQYCSETSKSEFALTPSAGGSYTEAVGPFYWSAMLPESLSTCETKWVAGPLSAIQAITALTATTTEYGNLVASQSPKPGQSGVTVDPVLTTSKSSQPQVTTSANPVPAPIATTSKVSTSSAPAAPGTSTMSQSPAKSGTTQQEKSAIPAPSGSSSKTPANPEPAVPMQSTSSQVVTNSGPPQGGSSSNLPANSESANSGQRTSSQVATSPGPPQGPFSSDPAPSQKPSSAVPAAGPSPGSSSATAPPHTSEGASSSNPPSGSGTTSTIPITQGGTTPASVPQTATSASQKASSSASTTTAIGSQAPVPSNSAETSAISIAGTTIGIAPSGSAILVGSTVISAGSAATIDGTVISLASSGTAVVIGSSTYAVTTTAGYGSLIWSGLGGGATTSATAPTSVQSYTGAAEKKETTIWLVVACSFVGVVFL